MAFTKHGHHIPGSFSETIPMINSRCGGPLFCGSCHYEITIWRQREEETGMNKTKLEVTQWQFDEIESVVWHNPGGQEWLDASLVLMPYDNVMDVEDILYVFFGTLADLVKWKRREESNFGEYDYVILATQGRNKIEGRRAKTKRVYGLDGDKKWYWENFHDPMVKETLEAMYMLESRYGQAK